MNRFLCFSILAGVLATGPAWATDAVPPDQPGQLEKIVYLRDGAGRDAGMATISDTEKGALIKFDLKGLPQGEHAVHIHEKAMCDVAAKFESAGAHLNPDGHEHGKSAENGPHAGDMPNIEIDADGTFDGEILNDKVSLTGLGGRAVLLDADGTALIVHASADDYSTQPGGNAGDRIACGEIK